MKNPTKFSLKFCKAKCQFEEKLFSKFFNANKFSDVDYERNIKYDKKDDNLYLNLCYPKNKNWKKLPIFIYIHGGGWVSSRPENREGIVSRIVEKGFFTVNIYYGLAPEYKHPKPIENIYKALAFLIDNAERYNIDLDNIYLGGESAGAHLASVMGAISSNEEYKNKFNLDKKSKDLKFKGLYLICGIYDLDECLKSKFPFMKCFLANYYDNDFSKIKENDDSKTIFPQKFVTSNYPKSYIITAKLDQLKSGGLSFYNKLNSLNVPCKHFLCKGPTAFHAFGIVYLLKNARKALDEGIEFLLN